MLEKALLPKTLCERKWEMAPQSQTPFRLRGDCEEAVDAAMPYLQGHSDTFPMSTKRCVTKQMAA